MSKKKLTREKLISALAKTEGYLKNVAQLQKEKLYNSSSNNANTDDDKYDDAYDVYGNEEYADYDDYSYPTSEEKSFEESELTNEEKSFEESELINEENDDDLVDQNKQFVIKDEIKVIRELNLKSKSVITDQDDSNDPNYFKNQNMEINSKTEDTNLNREFKKEDYLSPLVKNSIKEEKMENKKSFEEFKKEDEKEAKIVTPTPKDNSKSKKESSLDEEEIIISSSSKQKDSNKYLSETTEEDTSKLTEDHEKDKKRQERPQIEEPPREKPSSAKTLEESSKLGENSKENNRKDQDFINSLDIVSLSHDEFVQSVKKVSLLENKIKLMGRRIHFLNISTKELVKNNEALVEGNEALKEKMLLVRSDYENDKKRLEEKNKEFQQQALKKFITDIIGTIDIFELALGYKVEDEVLTKWLSGFKMIYNNLFGVLQSNGVEKMDVKLGEKPDYNFHSTIELIESDEYAPGTIAAIRQQGYMLNGKLLRPASVAISKPKDKESGDSKNVKDSKDKKDDKIVSSEPTTSDGNHQKDKNSDDQKNKDKKHSSKEE